MKIDLLAPPPSSEVIDHKMGAALERWATIDLHLTILCICVSVFPLFLLLPVFSWAGLAFPVFTGFSIWIEYNGFRLGKADLFMVKLGRAASICYLMVTYPHELLTNHALMLGGFGMTLVGWVICLIALQWAAHAINELQVVRDDLVAEQLFKTNHIRDPLLFSYYGAVKKAKRKLIRAELNAMMAYIHKSKGGSLTT